MGIGAAIGGIASAGASLIGSSNASDAQTSAAQQANNTQMQMFNQTQNNLAPYMQGGNLAENALLGGMGLISPSASGSQTSMGAPAAQAGSGAIPDGSYKVYNGNIIKMNSDGTGVNVGKLPFPSNNVVAVNVSNGTVTGTTNTGQRAFSAPLTSFVGNTAAPQQTSSPSMSVGTNPLSSPLLAPISMDEATLQQTPGYQFNLTQGLKATQNAAAARGLGVSGAALKGADTYATGLADSTYQNQFNNAVTNQTNQFNRLYSVANSGQNAAAGLGGLAQQTGSNIGNNITGAGNAQAAADIAGANGITNAANNYQGYNLAQQALGMYGNQSGSYDPTAAANGLPWSDMRLKENIVAKGTENGWPVYEFNYKGTPGRFIGVMAQEVAAKMPSAVKERNGFLTVDYAKLGVKFRRVHGN